MMDLLYDLKWRYACKKMNGSKIEQDKINTILEAIRLAPTSCGLQAFKVFVIENQELKDKIYEVSKEQDPVKSCSHLLVFASRTQITGRYLDSLFDIIKQTNDLPTEQLSTYRSGLEHYIDLHYSDMEEWLAKQTYIALGIACLAAANLKIDSVPMEGFDNDQVNKILNLTELGLKSTVMLPLGYRDEANDWNVKLKKARKPADRIFIEKK